MSHLRRPWTHAGSASIIAKNIFNIPFLGHPLKSEQDILLNILSIGKPSMLQDKCDGGNKTKFRAKSDE